MILDFDAAWGPGWKDKEGMELALISWNAGATAAREIRQARLMREWPALAVALNMATQDMPAAWRTRYVIGWRKR